MLVHHLSGHASEWCLASHHYPECYPKRVQIRADVHPTPPNCSGLANSGVPAKPPGAEIADSGAASATPLASPRSIIFAVTPPPSSKLTMMLLGLMSL